LGQGLAAFIGYGRPMENIVFVTMSEFGRTGKRRQSRDGSRSRELHVRDGGDVKADMFMKMAWAGGASVE